MTSNTPEIDVEDWERGSSNEETSTLIGRRAAKRAGSRGGYRWSGQHATPIAGLIGGDDDG